MLLPWRAHCCHCYRQRCHSAAPRCDYCCCCYSPLPPSIVLLLLQTRYVGVEGGARGAQHGRQTHFTCVEKINAKRLKKQLPHKLRSVSVRRTTTNRRIHGRAKGGWGRIKLATKGHASKQTNKRGGGGCGRTYKHILAIRHLANKCAKHAKTCKMHCEIETALPLPPAPCSLLLLS